MLGAVLPGGIERFFVCCAQSYGAGDPDRMKVAPIVSEYGISTYYYRAKRSTSYSIGAHLLSYSLLEVLNLRVAGIQVRQRRTERCWHRQRAEIPTQAFR